MKAIKVTAAVLRQGDKILVARRKPGSHLAGHWEFPGGKIEPGETPEECLKRELMEEFSIESEVGEFFAENTFSYKEKTIRLMAYEVEYIAGEFQLDSHDKIEWCTVDEMDNYTFAPADIPFIEKLKG